MVSYTQDNRGRHDDGFVKNQLEAADMWFNKRMLETPWADKKSGENTLTKTNSQI